MLDWIMSRHVHEYLDTSGRPVGEGRAAAFEQVETEMRTCPYVGSRFHHVKPMNLSALQDMPDWQQILIMLRWFGQRYRARKRKQITTADDLAQVTSAGVFLVDFLVLRQCQPLQSGEIPVLISALYKTCLGLQLAYLPERFADQSIPVDLPNAAGFYAYLEQNELLIGDAEVCAGSPAMIMQAYEAISGGHTLGLEDLPAACTSLNIDWGAFDIFNDNAAKIWHDMAEYAIRMPDFCPRLVSTNLPAEVQRRLNALLERRSSELLEEQTGLVVDIARRVREYAAPSVDPPIAAWSGSRTGGLAATVLAWLSSVAPDDMLNYSLEVGSALQARLASYDIYEEALIDSLNLQMSSLLHALGLGSCDRFTASALSRVCGRTLRDWGRVS